MSVLCMHEILNAGFSPPPLHVWFWLDLVGTEGNLSYLDTHGVPSCLWFHSDAVAAVGLCLWRKFHPVCLNQIFENFPTCVVLAPK